MAVYIIREGDTDRVKIGWAMDAAGRVRALQTGHHERLTIAREIEGPRSTETWMHRRFNAQRIGREWFHFHPDMLTVKPPFSHPGLWAYLETGDPVLGRRLVERLLDMAPGQLSQQRYDAAACKPRCAA